MCIYISLENLLFQFYLCIYITYKFLNAYSHYILSINVLSCSSSFCLFDLIFFSFSHPCMHCYHLHVFFHVSKSILFFFTELRGNWLLIFFFYDWSSFSNSLWRMFLLSMRVFGFDLQLEQKHASLRMIRHVFRFVSSFICIQLWTCFPSFLNELDFHFHFRKTTKNWLRYWWVWWIVLSTRLMYRMSLSYSDLSGDTLQQYWWKVLMNHFWHTHRINYLCLFLSMVLQFLQEKIESATDVLKTILRPVVDKEEEIHWPPKDPETLVLMQKVWFLFLNLNRLLIQSEFHQQLSVIVALPVAAAPLTTV